MQEQGAKNNDKCKDPTHELWLIYCQLKNAETEPEVREQLISSARYRLGQVLNALKSPGIQPANLNCRNRQKDLTPDT
jgi:hypothetical protein